MQIEFREKRVACLRELAVEILYQEETAELIVPDSYPDAGQIVDADAVCCLRDQDVSSGCFKASGAFQASVLYTAEESGEACAMSAWLPFSVKLSREDIPANGTGRAEICVRSVDVRILNSRKLMVRIGYAARLSVWVEDGVTVWETEQGSPLQLRKRTRSMYVPVACAEKYVSFHETVEIPPMGGQLQRLVKTIPEIRLQEQKLVDGKAVCRGELALHMVGLLENGQVASAEFVLPLSQYLSFPEDENSGDPMITASLTEFQLEEDAPGVYLAAIGVCYQCFLWREAELPLIEDGFCIGKELTADYDSGKLRQLLDTPETITTAEAALRGKVRQMIDARAWVDFPVCRRSRDEITASSAILLHAVYYDMEGRLCGERVRLEEGAGFALGEDAVCYADATCSGAWRLQSGGEHDTLSCPVSVRLRCFSEQTYCTMRSAVVGNELSDTAERPSLIVRRCREQEELWDIAKACGAAIQSIRDANQLQSDTLTASRILLIPTVS